MLSLRLDIQIKILLLSIEYNKKIGLDFKNILYRQFYKTKLAKARYRLFPWQTGQLQVLNLYQNQKLTFNTTPFHLNIIIPNTQLKNMEESNYSDDFDIRTHSIPHKKPRKTTYRPKIVKNTNDFEESQKQRTIEWFETKKSATYYWNDVQNRKYIKFLKESGYLLELPPNERKIKKVNLTMSKRIKTRNSTQCHTHHQKMMAKYGSIPEIISHYQFLFEGKKKAEIQEQTPIVCEKRHEEKHEEVGEMMATVVPAVETVMEAEFLSLDNIVLGEQLFDNYFQINERELMSWLDQ